MTAQLSVVYITLNAERLLERSIRSVRSLAEDIVVVDSGSTDGTLAICAALGVRVIQRPWPGFGAQRQFAVSQAAHDWVLIVDADELVPESIHGGIRRAIAAPGDRVAFRLGRRNYLAGRPVRFGDWRKDRVLRLVDRRRGHYSEDPVHERWIATGPVGDLPGWLLHYPFADYRSMLAKLQTYAALNAEGLVQRGRRVKASDPISHSLWAFLRTYLFRLGFLDGVNGAAIAWTTALGAFMKYATALELQEQAAKEKER
ncbi:MAG: glycosyltransferase family 2 protein [Gammaproteobacteria bacterium]|nr:glycosyltransferase family 2 protein [Gammaproteobacteria bacterium]